MSLSNTAQQTDVVGEIEMILVEEKRGQVHRVEACLKEFNSPAGSEMYDNRSESGTGSGARTYVSELSIAVICSSNMNRSMEAHGFLAKKGFKVRSFGTGEKIKLPGMSIDKPNVYEFGQFTYDDIYQDLQRKDKAYYTQNGLLHMLDRNRRIKKKPEKFQHCTDCFELIITAEERVYDQVVDYMESKDPVHNLPVHVVNIDIQDNHEEATLGAFLICDMVSEMASSSDLDNDIDELLHDFEAKTQRPVLHSVLFY